MPVPDLQPGLKGGITMRKARIYDARQLPAYLSTAQYAELMSIDKKTVQKINKKPAGAANTDELTG